jgi:hypothetical protein
MTASKGEKFVLMSYTTLADAINPFFTVTKFSSGILKNPYKWVLWEFFYFLVVYGEWVIRTIS